VNDYQRSYRLAGKIISTQLEFESGLIITEREREREVVMIVRQ